MKLFIWGCERMRGNENLEPSTGTSSSQINVHIKFQLRSSIWREDMGGIAIFQEKQRKNLNNSLSNWFRGFIFWNVFATFDFLSIGLKKGNFFVFGWLTPPPSNLDTTEFWLHFIPTHIYLIRWQERFWLVLSSVTVLVYTRKNKIKNICHD